MYNGIKNDRISLSKEEEFQEIFKKNLDQR